MNVKCGTDIHSGSKIEFLRIHLILQATTSNCSSYLRHTPFILPELCAQQLKLDVKNLMLRGTGPRQQSPGSTPQQMPTLIIPHCQLHCVHYAFLSWEQKETKKAAGRSVRPHLQKYAVILFSAASCCISLYNVPLPM